MPPVCLRHHLTSHPPSHPDLLPITSAVPYSHIAFLCLMVMNKPSVLPSIHLITFFQAKYGNNWMPPHHVTSAQSFLSSILPSGPVIVECEPQCETTRLHQYPAGKYAHGAVDPRANIVMGYGVWGVGRGPECSGSVTGPIISGPSAAITAVTPACIYTMWLHIQDK